MSVWLILASTFMRRKKAKEYFISWVYTLGMLLFYLSP
jgi:hypothetical protein